MSLDVFRTFPWINCIPANEQVCDGVTGLAEYRWWSAAQCGGQCWSLILVLKWKLIWHLSYLFTNLKWESKYFKDYSCFWWAPYSVDISGVGCCEPAWLPGDWDIGLLLQYCARAEFSIDIWSATILTRINCLAKSCILKFARLLAFSEALKAC